MKLPNDEEMRAGLRRWREDVVKMSFVDVAAESNNRHCKEPFSAGQATHWERGERELSYKRLVEDVLPAYGIEDFDTFLDFCRKPTLKDVTVINAKDFATIPIVRGIVTTSIKRGFLGEHRTRIDRVIFAGKGKKTPWARHRGHEFVLVLRGTVECEISETEYGEKDKYTLAEGMAIAFHSELFHRFYNPSDDCEAEIVAAKPCHGEMASDKNERV